MTKSWLIVRVCGQERNQQDDETAVLWYAAERLRVVAPRFSPASAALKGSATGFFIILPENRLARDCIQPVPAAKWMHQISG